MVMLRFLTCAPAFLAFAPPLPFLLFALNLPRRLEAAADALTGVVNTDLLHLLRLPLLMLTEIQATLKIIENLISSGRTTYLETRWRFVRDAVRKGWFRFEWGYTSGQLAHVFTNIGQGYESKVASPSCGPVILVVMRL
jgi:hypothetical protein